MKQFISPKVLIVNGAPAVCECEGDTVCWACVQANLLLFEKSERPDSERAEQLCQAIKRLGARRVARTIGLRHQTVTAWVKRGKINPRYLPSVTDAVESLSTPEMPQI